MTAIAVLDDRGISAAAPQLPWAGSASPAARYLAKLSKGSVPTQKSALRTVASILGCASPDVVPWHALTISTAGALAARIREGRHPNTANRIIIAIRGVLNVCRKERWLVVPDDGHYRMSQAEWYEELVGELSTKTVHRASPGVEVHDDDIRRIAEFCRPRGAMGARDAALAAVGFGAGLRVAEIVALELRDITHDGRVRVRGGKGDKDRTSALPPSARRVVEAWVAVRGDAPGPLFVAMTSHGGFPPAMKGITPHSAWNRIVYVRDALGITFTPHDMRRTAATRLLREGVPLKLVQNMLGHADIKTTARYQVLEEDEMVRKIQSVDVPMDLNNDAGTDDNATDGDPT